MTSWTTPCNFYAIHQRSKANPLAVALNYTVLTHFTQLPSQIGVCYSRHITRTMWWKRLPRPIRYTRGIVRAHKMGHLAIRNRPVTCIDWQKSFVPICLRWVLAICEYKFYNNTFIKDFFLSANEFNFFSRKETQVNYPWSLNIGCKWNAIVCFYQLVTK